jgi:two-component system cell cycle sensor histidine kinase/response regulator CckA
VLQAARDITERKRVEAALRESEHKLSVVLESVDAYIYLKDTQGRYLFANRPVRELFGVSMEMIVGQTDAAFFDAETLRRMRNNDRLVLEEGLTVRVEETTLNLKDGRTSTYLSIKHPLRNDAGEIYALCGVSTDITEQKQLEEMQAALETQSRQRQKAESLGLMAGAIAHHFNNHLQSVTANLELLKELPEGMDPGRLLTRAMQATERAAEMSRLLLISLGRIPGVQEPRFLFDICQNSMSRLRDNLPETMDLETDYPSPGPVINADTDQIQLVLTNLVANARDALDGTGGSIRISLKTCPAEAIPAANRFPISWQPQGSDYACLEVRDTGCGIAATDIEKLFDPFFSTKFIGRGMGLSVVLGIVQVHGGGITVESKPGQGSAFRAYFPVSKETLVHLPEAAGAVPDLAGGGGTILLVDDDALLLESAGGLIERMGFSLLTAQDGIEALEVFQQHKEEIRCVITDLTMPRMDGWATLSALHRLDPTLPVILASGYDRTQVMASSHPDRPKVYLNKPFNLQQLRDALGQALGLAGGDKT